VPVVLLLLLLNRDKTTLSRSVILVQHGPCLPTFYMSPYIIPQPPSTISHSSRSGEPCTATRGTGRSIPT
jgi:hypothetical protein